MGQEEFYQYINAHRDPNIWSRSQVDRGSSTESGQQKNGQWELVDSVVNHVGETGINAVKLLFNKAKELKLFKYNDEKLVID